jgi:hypothetical protein
MLVMYSGRVVDSIHVYSDTCKVIVNLVAAGPEKPAALRLPQLASRACGRVKVRILSEPGRGV